MKIVNIVSGKVYNVTPHKTLEETIGLYAPSICLVEAPDEAAPGWLYADGAFTQPKPTTEPNPEPVPERQPTNAEVAQMIADLEVSLMIAGVI